MNERRLRIDERPDIEDRLRFEAMEMLTSVQVPQERILNAYRRRQLWRKGTGGALLVLLLIGAAALRPQNPIPNSTSEHQPAVTAEGSRKAPEFRLPIAESEASMPKTEAQQPHGIEAVGKAVPVVFVQQADDGTEIIIPGIFVPGVVAPIDPKRLSPIERRAIQEVLGIKDSTISNQMI